MADRKSSARRTKTNISQEENLESLTVIESSKPKGLRKSKLFIPVIIIAVAVVLFFAKGFFIAALVNGQPISRLEIISELEKRAGKNALTALVQQTLILQEAKKKGIEVSQKEIDTDIKQIEDALKKQSRNLDSELLAKNMTRKDLEKERKFEKILVKLLANDTKVTDKEVKDYKEKNKATLPEGTKDEEIKKGLEQQKLSIKYQELITKLEKDAKINYFVTY